MLDAQAAGSPSDEELVTAAAGGDREALETLLVRHQPFVYHLALRMVWDPDDARDVTQDVLLRVLEHLPTFRRQAKFTTWLYRIAVNHVLHLRQRKAESMTTTFTAYGDEIAAIPDLDPPDSSATSADVRLLVEEARIGCLHGMLLCLDREQRLVYVLAEIFGVSDRVGAEITGLTAANFRQRLARARRDLYSFMNERCGLVRKENPCRCARKTRGFVQLGMVNPESLRFADHHVRRIREIAPSRARELDRYDAEHAEQFRDAPFGSSTELAAAVRRELAKRDVRRLLALE